MGDLSFLEYEALRDRVLRWGREIATDIKQHITDQITQLGDRIMAALDDARDRIIKAAHDQFVQTQDAHAKIQEALDQIAASDEEKAALQAALDAATASADAAVTALDAASTELESDDPAAPPVEPPVEPTP